MEIVRQRRVSLKKEIKNRDTINLNMRTIKRITPITFILPLITYILPFILILFICYCLQFANDPDDYTVTIIFSIIYFVIYILPNIILQFNYAQSDKQVHLEIDDAIDFVSLTDGKKEYVFKLSEIDRIRIVDSDQYSPFLSTLPWLNYHFYMICLKNDDEFLVTRLIARRLEKILKVRVVKQTVFFPYITKYYLNRAKNKKELNE